MHRLPPHEKLLIMKVLPKNASQFSDLYSLSFNERVGYSTWHSSTQEGFYHCDSWPIKTKNCFLTIQKKLSDYPTFFELFPCDYKSFPTLWMSFWDERFFFKTSFILISIDFLSSPIIIVPWFLDVPNWGIARTMGMQGNSDHTKNRWRQLSGLQYDKAPG